MKTIQFDVKNEMIIQNSKFITLLIKIHSNDISAILSSIEKDYPKATHYCYGYIYGSMKGCSDDGEPSRTAGLPMLNVLEKEELNNILAVTVRYFGGIKLGAGGLVRAYTKSVTEALKLASKIELEEGYKIQISFDYSQENAIHYLLKDSVILEKSYEDQICYIVLVNNDIKERLVEYPYTVLENVWIEKRM